MEVEEIFHEILTAVQFDLIYIQLPLGTSVSNIRFPQTFILYLNHNTIYAMTLHFKGFRDTNYLILWTTGTFLNVS